MSENFVWLAKPWWVNLIFLIPFIAYYFWRGKLNISWKVLLSTGIFAVAFGFVEAAVVVYLRIAGGISEIVSNANVLAHLPQKLLNIETIREAATMIMLIAVPFLSIKGIRERWAIYFWTFAIWDIFYYAGLFLFIGWPTSLTTPDVLFLIPQPWYAQVWFAYLVSGLFILSVLAGRKKQDNEVRGNC